MDGVNSYACSCTEDYTGQHCEDLVDKCAGIHCQNGGYCTVFGSEAKCICIVGYTGKFGWIIIFLAAFMSLFKVGLSRVTGYSAKIRFQIIFEYKNV